MKRALVAVALLALSSPAVAQTSRCGWEGSQWVCRADPTVPPPERRPAPGSVFQSFQRGVEAGRATTPDEQSGAGGTTAPDKNDQTAGAGSDLARRVGALIDAGNCDAGISLALREGDLVMAQAAKTYCGK